MDLNSVYEFDENLFSFDSFPRDALIVNRTFTLQYSSNPSTQTVGWFRMYPNFQMHISQGQVVLYSRLSSTNENLFYLRSFEDSEASFNRFVTLSSTSPNTRIHFYGSNIHLSNRTSTGLSRTRVFKTLSGEVSLDADYDYNILNGYRILNDKNETLVLRSTSTSTYDTYMTLEDKNYRQVSLDRLTPLSPMVAGSSQLFREYKVLGQHRLIIKNNLVQLHTFDNGSITFVRNIEFNDYDIINVFDNGDALLANRINNIYYLFNIFDDESVRPITSTGHGYNDRNYTNSSYISGRGDYLSDGRISFVFINRFK
jgi:hypothetical protein